MIDQLVTAYSKKRHAVPEPGYTPDMAILDRKLINPDASNLTVIFPPWHGANLPLKILSQRLSKSGSAVLLYTFHDQILKADVDQVVESHKSIKNQAVIDILQAVEQYSYESISFIGISLGTLAMAVTAQAYPAVKRATFVAGASRLAPCVWDGLRTQKIRQNLEVQGQTLENLELAWEQLRPSNSAPVFTGKGVRLVVSNNDQTIPTVRQYELVKSMQTAGADVTQTNKKVGHISTIIDFCTRGDIS